MLINADIFREGSHLSLKKGSGGFTGDRLNYIGYHRRLMLGKLITGVERHLKRQTSLLKAPLG